MSTLDKILEVVQSNTRLQEIGNYIAVSTQCLYPSNGSVTVFIAPGKRECVVTDNGEAFRVVRSHGHEVQNLSRWLAKFSKPYGLLHDKGSIYSPSVPFSALAQVIILVANASAEAAHYAIRRFPYSGTDELKEVVHSTLLSSYGKEHIKRDIKYTGFSNKTYEFDFLIHKNDSKILLDAVSPFAPSINAKYVSHSDLGRLVDGKPEHKIIYDRNANWKSEDLSLLQSAADLVAFDKFKDINSPFSHT